MKRFALALVVSVSAAACGGGAPPATTPSTAGTAAVQSSDQDWEPCPVPVPPNTGDWKLVEITNITFCVPSGWQVSATQARATGNRLSWGSTTQRVQVVVSGMPPGQMSGSSIANAGASSAGTTMARRITENVMVGGQMGAMWYEEGTGRVATGISFTRPTFSMAGEASGKANVDLQLAIYRTIRFID